MCPGRPWRRYATACNDVIGYSDGSFRADDEDLASGGQCDGGLKMIIAIGETEFSTSGNRSGDDNPCHDPVHHYHQLN